MDAYENGGHAYHTTMPTDSLHVFQQTLAEAKTIGFDQLKARQEHLGQQIRTLVGSRFPSVAAPGFEASSVVVSYTDNPTIKNGSAFAEVGIQIAGGVPLMCDEPADFQSFRLGLFGLDKLNDVSLAVERFERVFEQLPE